MLHYAVLPSSTACINKEIVQTFWVSFMSHCDSAVAAATAALLQLHFAAW
jgi:hypothetical protein